MDKKYKEELSRIMGEHLRFDCSLAPYTTFGVGGKADILCEVRNEKELKNLVSYLYKKRIPYLVVGLGSNLLITDKGIEGVAIRLSGSLASIQNKNHHTNGNGRMSDESTVITVGGGLKIADLLAHCRSYGLGGVEFLAGIPATVGGAVAMNAGAFGKEIGSVVQNIHLITLHGALVIMDRSQLRFAYRHLDIKPEDIIIRVSLKLERKDKGDVAGRITDYLRIRNKTQPMGHPTAGSIFKNPPGEYAAKLIEKVGLKGKRIGGAVISPKHANFIVNTGDASANDILSLMNVVREKVKEATGIELEPEIRVTGR